MKEKQDDESAKVLRALRRAADKVAEDAIKNNYKIPIWEDGEIKFVIPKRLSH